MVPTILANDPSHLIFDEPDNYASRGFPTYLGPMGLRNLVYNVHIYCGARSPVTGNPTNVDACADQEALSSASGPGPSGHGLANQPGGRPGSSPSSARPATPYVASITALMDAEQVGWIYWSWKYYGDPTGSSDESLVMADGRLSRRRTC